MTQKAVYDLVNFVSGIASCATACPCCRSHSESAERALIRFELAAGITREQAYAGARSAEKARGDAPASD